MWNMPNTLCVFWIHVYVRQTLYSWFSTTSTTVLKTHFRFHILKVLGFFNNWNIITLSHKTTTSEVFRILIRFLLMESVTIFPRWLNIVNIVSWIQYFIQKWDTMWLSLSRRPTLYRKTQHVMEKLVKLV